MPLHPLCARHRLVANGGAPSRFRANARRTLQPFGSRLGAFPTTALALPLGLDSPALALQLFRRAVEWHHRGAPQTQPFAGGQAKVLSECLCCELPPLA